MAQPISNIKAKAKTEKCNPPENSRRNGKNGPGRDNDFFQNWAKNDPWKNGQLPENTRIDLEAALENFKYDASKMEIRFPSNLTSEERKFVHKHAHKLGYNTVSEGKEPNRFIKVSKKSSDARPLVDLDWCPKSVELIRNCLSTYPVSSSLSFRKIQEHQREIKEGATGSELLGLKPRLAKKPVQNKLTAHRRSLPIWNHRLEILNMIESSSVVCVKGSTGSGKTTQVPQYILEDAYNKGKNVQIMVTVPRRIAAITLAERVSDEMGEETGQSVGYQVRFESNCSPEKTVVTYCTTGVLLRCLSMNSKALSQLTHIVMDEIHERDRFTDFLLTCLRRILGKFPQLRVIIMGADMNIELFVQYFGGKDFCPSVNVEGRLFGIKTYFLEEILSLFDHEETKVNEMTNDPPVFIRPRVDILIQDFSTYRDEKDFNTYLDLMKKYEFSIHYKHRLNKVSMLETTDAAGRPDLREKLIHESSMVNKENPLESADRKTRVENYLKESDPDRVDLDLLARLIKRIDCYTSKEEAVLVFLPGLDDILNLKRMLFYEEFRLRGGIEITVLHSSIQAKDQKNAFKKPPDGVRKVLLSTNISESSITVNDVIHVIDSGRAKEKSYDCTSGISLLQSVWISKASANQRQGRAGRIRPGFCYRMYSFNRYESLKEYQIPEILRLSLLELCLTAKSFLSSDGSIEKFFEDLPEPPSAFNVTSAIEALKSLGALTDNEQMTSLGHRLSQMPVEPNMGKALLYGIVFRCVDPVLTIIASLSHRDPFIIPTSAADKSKLTELKKSYAKNEASDFSVLHNVYEAFMDRFRRPNSRDFCDINFISYSTMQMISGIRGQLLSHLRDNKYVNRGQNEYAKVNKNSKNWFIINAVLTSCLQPNFAQVNFPKNCFMNGLDQNIKLHQSSVLVSMKTALTASGVFLRNQWVAFNEMTCMGGANMIKDCVSINTVTLALFGGSLHVKPVVVEVSSSESVCSTDSDNMHVVTFNGWIRIQSHKKDLEDLIKVRSQVNTIMQKYFKNPKSIVNEKDENIIRTVESVLQSEWRTSEPEFRKFAKLAL